MFSEIGKLHAKKIIFFMPAGECVQSVQSLEERLEQSSEDLFKYRIPLRIDF